MKEDNIVEGAMVSESQDHQMEKNSASTHLGSARGD